MSAAVKLQALDGAASPAPWERRNLSNLAGDGPTIASVDSFDWVATVQVSNVSEWRENANLLVSLRNALPQLVAIVHGAESLPETFVVEGRTHSFVPLLDELEKALP